MAPSRKKIKKYWLWWILSAVLVVFLARAVLIELERLSFLNTELEERQDQIEKTNQNIAGLEEEIVESSDSRVVERQARRTLNLKKEGEEVFVVVGIEEITEPENFGDVFENSFVEERGVWLNVKKWWSYFFK